MRQWCVECGKHALQAPDGSGISGRGVDAGEGTYRRYHRHFILDGIEHHHQGGANEHGVGHVQRVRVRVGQVFDEAHAIIAHVADDAGGDRRQLGRQFDARGGEQRAQRLKRGGGLGCEGIGRRLRARIHFGAVAEGAPEQIGGQPDDRIATARGTALHGFQQAAERLAITQLEHGRDRRLEIRDQACPHDLRLAGGIAARELAAGRLNFEVPADRLELGHGGGSFGPVLNVLLDHGCVAAVPTAERLFQCFLIDR